MAIKINNIEYSGFFYNGEALTAMYLNGNKVYGSEPQEYSITLTPVEWVSNENISTRIWLDLGYVWKNNSRAQLGFVIPGTHQKPNGQQVFGEDTVWASDGNGPVDDNNDLRLFFTKSGSNIGAYWDVATSRTQATIGPITDVWQHWEIGNNYIKNLSNNTNFVTSSTYSISRTGTVGLYGACQYLNTGRTDCVRYSYVKIYEGDTLVKDIIPVLDNNNIPCFFDKISEELIYYKVNGEPSTGLTAGNATGSTIKIVYSESSVTISNSSVSGITVGNTFNLNASVVPTGSTLTYTSSNPSVASVDSNGIVSGVASGSTTITITASEYVDDENRVVYRSGSTTVNLSVEEATSFNPLTDSKYFVVKANAYTTFSVYYINSPTSTIYYKKNGEDNWTTITGNTDVALSQGDYLEMKGDVDNTDSAFVYFRANASGNIDVGGCIMALNQNVGITLSPLNQLTNTYTFYRLFDGCTGLVSAEHLTMASNTTQSCYRQMFDSCTSLVNPPSLPATTLADSCYERMFYNCTSLTTAPVLPATNLAISCYERMFDSCTSLVNPPQLPATTLTNYCYSNMFWGCSSLVNPPSLPATTLTTGCYEGMFNGCTSLVIAPALSATTLASNCYSWMFANCTALTSLTVYFTSISSNNINKWFNNVDTVGTLYCPTMATYSESDLTLPSGWTISKTAWVEMEQNISYDGVDVIVTGTTKALNASTNAAGATLTYSSSNPNVASIDSNGDIVALTTGTTTISITASAWVDNVNYIHYLSATTTVEVTVKESYNPLIDSGYLVIKANTATTLTIQAVGITAASYGKISYRKNGGEWSEATTGTSNTSISLTSGDYLEMKGNINNSSSKYYRFSTDTASSIETGGCLMALVNNDKINNTNNTFSANRTFYNLYSGCTGLVSAEHLKLADNVKSQCYRNMFRGCSNLTKACQLPAMTVDAANAYTSMFNSCTSLTTAPSLPATTVAGFTAYSYMFENCTSLTSAPNLPCTNPAADAYKAMFKTCKALVNGPEIMSTSTASGQFRDMFSGCTSLTNVTVHLSDGSKVYNNWLSGVRTTGTLYCPSTATGTFYIPSSWTLSKTLSS